jgi:hypothetical protein
MMIGSWNPHPTWHLHSKEWEPSKHRQLEYYYSRMLNRSANTLNLKSPRLRSLSRSKGLRAPMRSSGDMFRASSKLPKWRLACCIRTRRDLHTLQGTCCLFLHSDWPVPSSLWGVGGAQQYAAPSHNTPLQHRALQTWVTLTCEQRESFLGTANSDKPVVIAMCYWQP